MGKQMRNEKSKPGNRTRGGNHCFKQFKYQNKIKWVSPLHKINVQAFSVNGLEFFFCLVYNLRAFQMPTVETNIKLSFKSLKK